MISGRGLLDTSVFIARETARPLDERRLPDESAISVVTLGELHAGVLAAPDVTTRAARLATLDGTRELLLVPIDEQVATVWAQLRAHVAENGRRANVNDLWIAASAVVVGVPVYTQDADYDPVIGVAGLQVVRV